MNGKSHILIVGAGLGGLTAAIALARLGFAVTALEAARAIERTGAGLTLGLGAQHVFRDLDLQRDIAAHACPAGHLPFLHGRTGKLLLGAFDTGDGLSDDGTANIVRHIYRADLQDVLIAAAHASGCQIVTGWRLAGLEQDERGVSIISDDGRRYGGDVLIGADGVRSVVRALLFPGDAPRFTGHVAYRCVIPIEQAAPCLSHGRSAIFIGPYRTFNRYTMSGGTMLNIGGLVESRTEVSEGWSHAASQVEFRAAFDGWHDDVMALTAMADRIIKWGLYDRALLAQWSHGRVTLLGDAAHAMLPFLGMGAAMAVEDGWALAHALSQSPDIGAAFARYEAARLPRTATVHAASAEQGRITQVANPDALSLAAAPVNNRAMMEFDPVAAGV